ncbi:programmed cell death protein 7-like [Gigantopelta aegis]|uniref:programmed cell death protein 7-like n=1 Tax=Gigantopelta aegis TaxID=1735272 RepID=UPI001B88A6AD|nr:programmed cell death protein 7-like [Gigantopelta aegis]
MEDERRFNHEKRFPGMQNAREQFNETHDTHFGSHTSSNTPWPMNQNVTSGNLMGQQEMNAPNPRWRNESHVNPTTDHFSPTNSEHVPFQAFGLRPPDVQTPSLDVRMPMNNTRQLSYFPKQTHFEPFNLRFPHKAPNSNFPVPPEDRGNAAEYEHPFPHQSLSQTGPPPLDAHRMNPMQPPVNYSSRHSGPTSIQMMHAQPPVRPPPSHPPPLPLPFSLPPPRQASQQPPPLLVGPNVMCAPPATQSVGHPDVLYFQHNKLAGQSNRTSIDHHQHDQGMLFSNKPTGQCQKDIDERWIANWLIGRLGKKATDAKKLKIYEAHDIIQNSMVLLATLQKQKKLLQTISDSADPATWQHEMMVAEATKMQLCNEQKKLTDEAVDSLELKLLARSKKRERIKRKRKADYENKLREEENRELKHQAIDKWRRQIIQKNLEEKQNKEIKASADVFLSEVRKKLSDVKKSTDLLHTLQKLRKIRKDFAEKQGRYSSVVYDEDFHKTVDNLTKLLKKQQDLYLEEEKTLKIMLENDWVEALEKEKEEKEYIDLEKQRRERKKHQQMLFGKQEVPSPSDDLYPFYQYYTQAKKNFDALVQIRHGWDMYLVPESFPGRSRIPDGWVLPCDPSSDTWASAVKH